MPLDEGGKLGAGGLERRPLEVKRAVRKRMRCISLTAYSANCESTIAAARIGRFLLTRRTLHAE
jgi:hypothetical protein